MYPPQAGPPSNWPPPQRQPQWRPPQGQPYWPVQAPVYGQPWQVQPPLRPRKSNTGLVIGVVAGVVVLGFVVLIGFGALAASRPKEALSAGDFDAVCESGSISNAGSFQKPYTVIVFQESAGIRDWRQMDLDNARTYSSDDDLSSINVVACLTRKMGTEVKIGTCDYSTARGERVADHYRVDWELELREAGTGDVIENLGTVETSTESCPFLVTVDPDSPKVYAEPTDDEVDEKLKEFTG